MDINKAKNTLGLDGVENLTNEIVQKKYRKLVKEYHPDLHVGCSEEEMQYYHHQTTLFNAAYEYLIKVINRTNEPVKEETSKSKSSSRYDDVDFSFILRKSKIKEKMKFYFDGCSDSELKNDIINLYHSIPLNKCSTEDELDKCYNEFMSNLKVLYSNFQRQYCIRNGVPAMYKPVISYNMNCDQVLKTLDSVKNRYTLEVNDRLNSILKNKVGKDKFLYRSRYLKSVYEDDFNKLFSYHLTEKGKKQVFQDIIFKLDTLVDNWNSWKKDYNDLVKRVRTVQDSFNDEVRTKRGLIFKLEKSIFDGDFDEVSIDIEMEIAEHIRLCECVDKMKRYLQVKSYMMFNLPGIRNNQEKVDSISDTMIEVTKILDDAKKGKYSFYDVSVLSGISFKNKDVDNLILSMFDKTKQFNINVTLPQYSGPLDKMYDPFLVAYPDGKKYITIGDKVEILDEDVVTAFDEVIPLKNFISEGEPIFKYCYKKGIRESVLVSYKGHDLVRCVDSKNGGYVYYYISPSRTHNFYFDEEPTDVSVLVEEDVCDTLEPFMDKIQSKAKVKRMINVNGK